MSVTSPVIDAHGHTFDLAIKAQHLPLHGELGGLTDVPLLRAGGVTAQLSPFWVPDRALGGPHGSTQPLYDVLRIVDYLHQELQGEAGDHVVLATTAGDIKAAQNQGQVAFILGLEGGDSLSGDLAVLRTLHRLGVRHLGLVHEGRNAFGTATQVWEGPKMRLYDPAKDPDGRLTQAGKDVIREMNRLGMLVDVTHLVEAGFRDALDTTRAPVIVTHGNARALRDTVRYLSDEQIRGVAATGGVICPSPMPLGPGAETANLAMLLDHIDYLVTVVGARHVGFGTDFLDQNEARPEGIGDVSETPRIVAGLRERGHDDSAIDGIMGGNFLRLFEEVDG